MKRKHYLNQTADMLAPQPTTPAPHPRCSQVGGQVGGQLAQNDASSMIGTILGQRKTVGAVASGQGHQPIITEEGTIVPGIVPGDINFCANPIVNQNPLLQSLRTAPTAVAEYQLHPVAATTPQRPGGIGPYAPGVSA